MALVIDLKPNEKVIIGSSTIINDKQRTRLRIEGDAPILREKDTMTEEEATTPSKQLYFIIQEMYLANTDKALDKIDDYFTYLDQIKHVAPHISNFLNDISIQILQGTYYKGLKLVHDLIKFEENGTEPSPDEPDKESQLNQMHMEAQLLSQSADQLSALYENWETTPSNEREASISYNRKLWMVFFDGVNDPKGEKATKNKSQNDFFDIQSNIINLYNFIYRRSAVLIEKGNRDLLPALISINREAAKAMRRY
jgi:flagellar protein FlbT